MSRYLTTVIVLVSVFYIGGCSLVQPYIDPTGKKKTTLYFAESGTKCAEGFTELEASNVYSGVSLVSTLVVTCIDVSDGNLTCPESNMWCLQKDIVD